MLAVIQPLDLNQFQGTQTIEQAAKTIVKYTTRDDDISTSKYFKEDGENAWQRINLPVSHA